MSVQTPEPESLKLPPTAEERVPPAITVLLAVLVLFAALTAAYVAAEVVLPVFLAIVLKLLLEPAMRFLTGFRLPRALCAILLILAIFAVFLGFGAFVSGPAVNWAHRLPSDLPHVHSCGDLPKIPPVPMHESLLFFAGAGFPILPTQFTHFGSIEPGGAHDFGCLP